MKQWSKKHKHCIDCKRTSVNHQARGRCVACYGKYMWKHNPKRKAQMLEASKKWRKNNPEKWNKIMAKAQKKLKAKIANKIKV